MSISRTSALRLVANTAAGQVLVCHGLDSLQRLIRIAANNRHPSASRRRNDDALIEMVLDDGSFDYHGRVRRTNYPAIPPLLS